MGKTLDWNAAALAAKTLTAAWQADAPGGAVIGFDANGIRFAQAGGLENLATRSPFTCRSVVRYASVTKHAFAAMVLSHPDAIGLEDPLGHHLPELREPLASVTVGQALDMSGGLPDTRECLTLLGLSVFTETRAPALFDYLCRQTRLNYAAGTEVSYSNTGYRLVEAALARKGLLFRAFIRAAGWQAQAVLDAPEGWNDPVEGLMPGYWHDGTGWQLSAAGLHISASGSMTGSAESLMHWLQALMAGEGRFSGLLERLSQPRRLADGRTTGYGLGLRQTRLGDRTFIGHGGSHPGYKTYFLLDPEAGTGFVIVSNREDTNGYKIALEAMAALNGLPLPTASTALVDGLYVTEQGPWWIAVKGSTVTWLDADESVYEDGDGWVNSRSASSPMRLRMEGSAIVGEVGHVPRRFLPADVSACANDLSGRWENGEGASFDIEEGVLVMGIGPVRQRMPLQPLGAGRFLFTLKDGPWTKRVCLHRLGDDHVELVLSRARMIEYRRRR
ncbi:CubicO group peptidase, beta-lactamase class C family [Rhizobium sp. RU35A]|uniref:serine hydrolase domain-containing protein n=1 Tax=Rhizobium sp. RU35A TaxID=1907414 RepID=UPI0009539C54|nr:serine hydrolase domain-containing protein [Rhizobium sp. RU35A]SIQ89814.1 CubicO group peptidase, beta-lactamase class C family [Rhizobium sp. RU35A]